ncbi:MAG: PspA/IM30 family protein [Pseudomonadales bacterium]|nr:PspA/IM30 family protein [Pseudomonadales bacterium]
MNIWAQMMTALRGGVNEVGEAIVDSQALRILDQEVRDTNEGLKQSKGELAAIMASQKLSEEKCTSLVTVIAEHESYVIKALEKNNEPLALEVAEKVANLESQLDGEKQSCTSFESNVLQLRSVITFTELSLKRLKQQVDTVKATENVQRAQAAVAQRHNGTDSKLRTAMDSLERIKEKQAHKAAQMESAQELAAESSNESLQDKLIEAGIVTGGRTATDVLERLKKKS